MLGLFVIFAWQNFRIEADEYIAIAATGYGEMLRDFQWLIPFVSIHLHLIPQTKMDNEEYEDNPNLTIRSVMSVWSRSTDMQEYKKFAPKGLQPCAQLVL